MHTRTPFIIFSASRSEYTDEINDDRADMLRRQLEQRDITAHVCEGVFEGIKETAFVVFAHDGSRAAGLIESLAKRYAQRCILMIDAAGLAYLRYMDGTLDREIGRLSPLTAYEASRRDHFKIGESYYSAGSEPSVAVPADPA